MPYTKRINAILMSLHFTRENPNLLESYLSKFSERKKHYAYKNVYRFYAGFPQIPENLFCEKIYKFIKLTCDICNQFYFRLYTPKKK